MRSFLRNYGMEIALYISFVIGLFCLPWTPPTHLNWTAGLNGFLTITLEKTNGEIISRELDTTKVKPPVIFLAQKVIKVSPPVLSDKIQIHPNTFATDFSRKTVAILISAAIFLGIFIYFKMLIRRIRNRNEKFRVITFFLANIFFFGFLLYCFSPGILNFDSFFYYIQASKYQFSEFIGFYYNCFLICLFQLFPYPWSVSAFNVLIISSFLTHLYVISLELNTSKYFYIACTLFYLYPANALMTIAVSRDPLSHWVLVIFLAELYLMLSFHKQGKSTLISMAFGIALISVFRPETVYVLLPYILFLAWKYSRLHFRWAVLSVLLSFSLMLVKDSLRGPLGRDESGKVFYETTLLINPLSYILKNKYQSILPNDISEKLGPFFKNDYLIKYQDDTDIPAFHHGGVNANATIEQYEQFRNASLLIFLRNPLMFIENRLKISSTMFGFRDKTYLLTNEYNFPVHMEKKQRLGFGEYKQSGWANNFFLFIIQSKPLFTMSYLIPFLVLIGSLLFSSGAGWYRRILLFMMARTLLVMLITPGGYFKYNYSLWLFPIFMLPMLVWEYRKFKNSDPIHGT